MTEDEIRRLLHPKEGPYFTLCVLVLIPICLVIAALVVSTAGGLLVVLGFGFLVVWFWSHLLRAMLIGGAVRIDTLNFPHIDLILTEVKRALGYGKPVEMFVLGEGAFNAFLQPMFKRKAILFPAAILEDGVSEKEIRWIIGRFVGGLRAKSYRLSFFQALLSVSEKLAIFNLLFYPYERAVVLSGDRIGLALIDGDIATAIGALNKLAVGVRAGPLVNPAGILRQDEELKTVFGFIAHIYSAHPELPRRYREILNFARERYPSQHASLGVQLERARIAPPSPISATLGAAPITV